MALYSDNNNNIFDKHDRSLKESSAGSNVTAKPDMASKRSQRMQSSGAFLQYYRDCYDTALENARKKHGSTFSHPTGSTCAAIVNRYIERTNQIHETIWNEIAPKLHQNIRENGMTYSFPISAAGGRTTEITEYRDSTVPFQTSRVGVNFVFCAPKLNCSVSSSFRNYYIDPSDDSAMLKLPLAKPGRYKPSWNASYDSEFSSLTAQIKKLEDRLAALRDNVSSAEHDLDLFRGNLITGAIGAVFKAIWAFILACLNMIGPGLVIGVLYALLGDMDIPYINVILAVIALLIFAGIFIYQCVETEVFEFISDFGFRQRARKEKRKGKRLLKTEAPGLEKQLQEILSSAKYREAERRNTAAYEADCLLAQQWQQEWYNACLNAKPKDII